MQVFDLMDEHLNEGTRLQLQLPRMDRADPASITAPSTECSVAASKSTPRVLLAALLVAAALETRLGGDMPRIAYLTNR